MTLITSLASRRLWWQVAGVQTPQGASLNCRRSQYFAGMASCWPWSLRSKLPGGSVASALDSVGQVSSLPSENYDCDGGRLEACPTGLEEACPTDLRQACPTDLRQGCPTDLGPAYPMRLPADNSNSHPRPSCGVQVKARCVANSLMKFSCPSRIQRTRNTTSATEELVRNDQSNAHRLCASFCKHRLR